jgi:hypothetical protein
MNPAIKQAILQTPRTRSFSFNDISSGFGGPIVTSGGNLYWLSLGGLGVSAWIGRIRGTFATIRVRNAGDSLDGNTAVSAIPAGGNDVHVLFSGLEDKLHTVVIYPGGGAYYQFFSTTNPAIINVSGTSPEIIPANTVISAGDFRANTVQSGFYDSYSQGGNTQTGTVPATLISRHEYDRNF